MAFAGLMSAFASATRIVGCTLVFARLSNFILTIRIKIQLLTAKKQESGKTSEILWFIL